MTFPRVFAFTVLIGVLVVAAPSAAQDVAAAEALFNRGVVDMEAGRYDAGCPAIAESQRLDPRAGTLFTLAECEAKRGRLATAVALYGDFLALVTRMPSERQEKHHDRVQTAIEQKTALASQVPELTLILPSSAPAGTVVKRDGVAFAGPSLGIGLPVDPGEHVVTTQVAGGLVTEMRFTIDRAEKKQIMLEIKAKATSTHVASLAGSNSDELKMQLPPTAAPGPRRVGVYVTGGVGLAGLVLGGVMGALTLGKKSTIDANCNAEKVCSHEGKLAADSAQTSGLVSTIGFGIGAAGLAAAAVLFMIEPASSVRASRTRPNRSIADTTRINASVLFFGQPGLGLGLEREW